MAKAEFKEKITRNEETGLPNLPEGFYWRVNKTGAFGSHRLVLKRKREVKRWYHLRDWFVWDEDGFVRAEEGPTDREKLYRAAYRMEGKRQFQEWKSQQPEYAPIPLGDYPPNTLMVD